MKNLKTKREVYIASPFFNPEQLKRVERMKTALEHFELTYYSPKDECILKKDASIEEQYKCFADNLDAIKSCDFVVAITDGKDMGTIWEAGYAYAIEKPVIYFAETLGNNPFNLMLAQSGISTHTDWVSFCNMLLDYKNDGKKHRGKLYKGEIE